MVAQLHERVLLRGHRPRFRAFPRKGGPGTANHRCYPYRVGVRVYATHYTTKHPRVRPNHTQHSALALVMAMNYYGNYHLPFYSRNFTGNILHGYLLFPVFTSARYWPGYLLCSPILNEIRVLWEYKFNVKYGCEKEHSRLFSRIYPMQTRQI